MPPDIQAAPVQWRSFSILFAGIAVTTIASLSVHAIALNYLRVPYPEGFPSNGWLPDRIIAVIGLIYLVRHLPAAVLKRPLAIRALILFFLFAMIQESFFRGPLMEIFVSTKWTPYPFIDNIPQLVPLAIVSVAIAALAPRLKTIVSKLVAAILVTALAYLLVRPLFDQAFNDVLRATAALEGDTLYTPPYDWHVQLPAYITFLEPVLGSVVACALMWKALAVGPRFPILACSAILFAIKGPIAAGIIYIFYANMSPGMAILSFGQFTLEALVLAILSTLTVAVAYKNGVRGVTATA